MDPRTWIPLTVVGPGSQREPDESPALDYLPLPAAMDTFRQPELPEPDRAAGCARALALLDALLAAFDAPLPVTLALAGLDAAERDFVGQALGEGEVAVRLSNAGGRLAARAQESALAGVWIVQHFDADGRLVAEHLELAPAPSIARAAWPAAPLPATARPPRPADVMNAPAVLAELEHRQAGYVPGQPAAVVNLSLLPLTPADRDWLGESLGIGAVTVLSRGYGNCRITAGARPCLWRVQYYNSMDTLILDTVEVVALPEVVCAAPEDFADSRERLAEIRALYR